MLTESQARERAKQLRIRLRVEGWTPNLVAVPRLEETTDDLLTAALLAAQAEAVKECAKVADAEKLWCETHDQDEIVLIGQVGASSRIAAAIRALLPARPERT